MIEYIKKRKGL